MKWIGKAILAGTLAAWYSTTGVQDYSKSYEKYKMPAEISVATTTLPYETRKTRHVKTNPHETVEYKDEKVVKTESIDFSKNFEIKTDRYTVVKNDDWKGSQAIGSVLSIPAKVYFWDRNVSRGLDEEKTRSVIAMLENDKSVKDITVRINHNEALSDMYKLFTDEKTKKRNNIIARSTLGVAISLKNELFAELFRSDYYNPMTQTAVVYTNIESIDSHEIGHHKDWQRFDRDWIYTIARAVPVVALYQEWKANDHACKLISENDQWQYDRYLLPAFFTYVAGFYILARKRMKKMKEQMKQQSKAL
jgi:hypothetical protein